MAAFTDGFRARRGGAARFVRALLWMLLALALAPYVLTVLYRVVDPVSTLMVWRWLRGAAVVRTVVPIDAVAPALPLAVIGAEDAKYCTHHGVDWDTLRGIVADNDDLEDVRGGSTLTQQVVKNLFLWPGRSYLRKALELPLALWMDLVVPKRRVMELYLNIAEWGPTGEFGAEAGARRAFGKPASELTPVEAATMAAVLPNPRVRSARQPGPAVRRLAGIYAARARSAPTLDACIRRRRTP